MPGRRALVLAAALASTSGAGCYATTPHPVEVFSSRPMSECVTAVGDVFTRAGLIEVSTPTGMTALFAPRLGGASSVHMKANSGVTVVATERGAGCHIILEAVATDSTCPDEDPFECQHPSLPQMSPRDRPVQPVCRNESLTCRLTPAPGPSNDKVVDDLARRLRAKLGPASGDQ